MYDCTLCYLVKEQHILLGYKKKGFGQYKYNGFGGKVKDGETIGNAAIRELEEEINVKVMLKDLTKVGKLVFYFPHKPKWNQIVHVFLLRTWQGIPQESEEMKPTWFNIGKLPFDKMWPDDPYWLPLILKGKRVEANFTFSSDNKAVLHYGLKELNL